MLAQVEDDVPLANALLDEQRSQSGLGLSIVVDLVALYQGELQLSRSVQGGLRVTVMLPVVAQR